MASVGEQVRDDVGDPVRCTGPIDVERDRADGDVALTELKSWYFFFFDLPDLPESVVHANRWHFFQHFLRDAHPAYTPEETERYVEAWSQPGAAAGMINYYRNAARQSPKHVEAQIRPISAPTLVIWGQDDR